MKDLLVYVADADALGFLRSILMRHQSLGMRAISFDIERHPQRDAGMVQSGAELTRMRKGRYAKAVLIWDHHGSGRDHRQAPQAVMAELQDKLDSFTWRDNSAVHVLVPELEQWLWFCEAALVAHCDITSNQLQRWLADRSDKVGRSVEQLKSSQPKELFEHILRERLRRTISPRDFELIGRRASVKALMACDSFRALAETLRAWFPQSLTAHAD